MTTDAGARTLVLVAGLPGAGKSTLLRRLAGPDVRVVDSDDVRARLARRWPAAPYRRYRPLVHALHRCGVVRAAAGPDPTVAVHLPATGAPTRAGLAVLAALTGRRAVLVWLEVDADTARGGQHARGRVVPERGFTAHARRAGPVADRLRAEGPVPGWSRVTVLDRASAAAAERDVLAPVRTTA